MLTLADISTARFQQVTGYCPGDSNFLEIINDAVAGLMRRGDWKDTLLPIQVCMRAGCVTWPRYVGQVRAMHDCRQNIPIRNKWWDFLPHQRGARHWEGWRGHERNMEMQYRTPVYNDIYGPNCYVRAYPALAADSGCPITIFGTDNNNQPLQTNNGNNQWTLGAQLSVAVPFGSTNTPVSHIDRVVVGPHMGNLFIYAYDAVNNWLYDIAVWEPGENNPNYLRYKLAGGDCNDRTCQKSIIALIKLSTTPIALPTDLVAIDNREALLDACRAIKRADANDTPGANALWLSAVEKLNRQLENEQPEEIFSAQNDIFGNNNRTYSNQMF